jgi:hypothetical protein
MSLREAETQKQVIEMLSGI